ncbi:hypothetical protein C0989_012378, partial [Termitomyces sp. Mn162]
CMKRSQTLDNGERSEENNPHPLQHGIVFTTKEMEALWADIESLIKPSWIQSPAAALGTSFCGKLKSDQWCHDLSPGPPHIIQQPPIPQNPRHSAKLLPMPRTYFD